LVVGDAGRGGRRVQHDRRPGLVCGTDGDPMHPTVFDVHADLEAECVAVEGNGCLRVVVGQEAGVDDDVAHDDQASCGSPTFASRFLTGLVTCFATHGGIPAISPVASRRYSLGGVPTSSVNLVLKVPSDEQPTWKQTSVTLRSPRRSSAIARSMRRVIR